MLRRNVTELVVAFVMAGAMAACTDQADRLPGAALPQSPDDGQATVVAPDDGNTVAVEGGAVVSDTAGAAAGTYFSATTGVDLTGAVSSTDATSDALGSAALGIDGIKPPVGDVQPYVCPMLTTATGDPGWMIVSGPGIWSPISAVTVGTGFWNGLPGARWVSVDSNRGFDYTVEDDNPRVYTYAYTFCLCDWPKPAAPAPELSLTFRSDNSAEVYVNNTLIGTSSKNSFGEPQPVTLTYNGNVGSGWKSGTNTLRIVVTDYGLETGLAAVLSVSRATAGTCPQCRFDAATGQAGWTLASGPGVAAPVPPVVVPPVAGWLTVPSASWVSSNASKGSGAGAYNYEVAFCLCDWPTPGAPAPALTLTFRSDNAAQVFVNAKSIGTANGTNFKAATPTKLTYSGPWLPGTNKLRIQVTNDDSSYTGLAATLGVVGARLGPCPSMSLYVSSRQQVLKYPLNGVVPAVPTVFATGPTSQNQGLAFGADGHLYVTDFAHSQVLRFHGATGAALGTVVGTPIFVPSQTGGLAQPYGLRFAPADPQLYVASGGAKSGVLRYAGAAGTFVDAFTGSVPVTARGLAFGTNGLLYVTGGQEIRRFDAAGKPLGIFATDANAPVHFDLAFGSDGSLYATANDTDSVVRFSPTGAALPAYGQPAGSAAVVPTGLGGLSRPTGLAFGPDGYLYVASTASSQILRYKADGTFVDVFAAGFIAPTYLAFGP